MTDYESRKELEDEIRRELKEIEEEISKISKNFCNKPKDIGDRVMVWDGSWSEDMETGEHYNGAHEIFKSPVIIIQKDLVNRSFNRRCVRIHFFDLNFL